MDAVVDAVTARARNTEIAFGWITRVEADDCSFEELGNPRSSMASLDAKLRTAITKHTTGSEAEKRRDLVSKLTGKREELKLSPMPKQISGHQLLLVVRKSF